jgi:RraA family protein
MSKLGFRIEPNAPLLAAELVEAYRPVVAAHISDSINRVSGSYNLRPFHGSGKLVGTALTVRVRSGDNLMLHKAIDMAQAGHVMVVDGGGDLSRALTGEIMALFAQSKGIAGFVIDGAIRDVAYFAKSDFPCYARGFTHRGPYKDGPGEVNVPVVVDGMVVHPGDLIVGDEDGVVAVPASEAAAVLALAQAKAASEEKAIAAIRSGTPRRAWVDETLRARMGAAG